MSEFPKSGLGSWAQWIERLPKAPLFAVDGDDPEADTLFEEWLDEHRKGAPGVLGPPGPDILYSEAEQAIADRRAG